MIWRPEPSSIFLWAAFYRDSSQPASQVADNLRIDVSWFLELEEKLGLFRKITLWSTRRRFYSGSAGPERVVRETCGFSSFIPVTAFVFPELAG